MASTEPPLQIKGEPWPATWPAVMGIVNAGGRSVSDRVRLNTVEEQVERAREMVAAGAAIIDVGAESGRTDEPERDAAEELALVAEPISILASEGIVTSVDTWKPQVAHGAVAAGAAVINDTSGLADIELARIAAETGAGLVIMHTRAKPKKENFPGYEDPVTDVRVFLEERMERAVAAGVDVRQILLDPGLDYAKTPAESVEVLRRIGELKVLGRPILLAVSRKFFVGVITDRPPPDRLGGTLAALEHGLAAGAVVARVHDVEEVCAYLQVRDVLESGAATPEMPSDERLKWLPLDN
ncbi:MAG TPA: dihydropteroate synthase [Thermoleophilaceae bacterium]|jgi:dihydropteroate synthase|nr:dihydropteroate synthase [Thermoleophilaceae bacterium]